MTAKKMDELKTDSIWSGIMIEGWDKKRFNEELNEYTNAKLFKIIEKLKQTTVTGASDYTLGAYAGLSAAIRIVESEITKKK